MARGQKQKRAKVPTVTQRIKLLEAAAARTARVQDLFAAWLREVPPFPGRAEALEEQIVKEIQQK